MYPEGLLSHHGGRNHVGTLDDKLLGWSNLHRMAFVL